MAILKHSGRDANQTGALEIASMNAAVTTRQSGKQNVMETMVAWAIAVIPFLIAIPMAIFGIQHFIHLQFVADFIPGWIPWHTFWACLTGVALIASAVGIIFRTCDRWAAALLGTMILLWVILLHTSRIAANPGNCAEWRGIFQALAMSGCAFALAQSLPSSRSAAANASTGLNQALTVLSEVGGKLAPWFIGISILALGLEHFIFPEVATPQVPLWIPGTTVGNYLTGITLVVLGVGICVPNTRRLSSLSLGILIFLSRAIVHLPVVLNSSRFESDWTKTLVLFR